MAPWSLREVSHFGPLPQKQVAARDPNMPTWSVRDAPEIRRCSEKETTVGGIHDGNLAAERAVAEMSSCCLGTHKRSSNSLRSWWEEDDMIRNLTLPGPFLNDIGASFCLRGPTGGLARFQWE
jgi:hypothetical protein